LKLTRRRFLGVAAGTLLAPHAARAAGRRRVVVVGAGLAGLACADALAGAGIEVVVFEARDRVGGRVLTIRDPLTGGRHAEAGGELFATEDVRVRALARRFRLAIESVGKAHPVVYRTGRRHAWNAFVSPRVERDIDRFRTLTRSLSGPGLDTRSVASLIREAKLGDRARFLVTHELRRRYGVEPESLSLAFYAQREHVALPGRTPIAYFRGGADLLPLALARRLDVRLEERASSIEQAKPGVRVNGMGADAVVITVPVPVLGTIAFGFALPPALLAAIEELRYGNGVKTVLQYEEGFRARGSVVTDLSFQTASISDRRVVAAYTTGRNALLYGTIGKRTRPLLVADELGEVFPGSRGRYLTGASYSWHTDGWSLGTAVAYAPGQVTRFQEVIRQPLGRVHFAGEHTDALAGTMEGAVRSGLRAASAVIAQR
jgi:monoamine oxidase